MGIFMRISKVRLFIYSYILKLKIFIYKKFNSFKNSFTYTMYTLLVDNLNEFISYINISEVFRGFTEHFHLVLIYWKKTILK